MLVANAENDNMQLAANATTINVRKRNVGSSLGMLAAANFDQRLYSATRKRRVTGSRVVGRIDIGFPMISSRKTPSGGRGDGDRVPKRGWFQRNRADDTRRDFQLWRRRDRSRLIQTDREGRFWRAARVRSFPSWPYRENIEPCAWALLEAIPRVPIAQASTNLENSGDFESRLQ